MDLMLNKYKVYLRKNEKAPNTIKNYLNTLKQLEQFCKSKKATGLTDEIVLDFKELFILKSNFTLKTINQKINVLNIYLNWLANVTKDQNILECKVKQEKIQHLSHKQYLNAKEFNRVIKNCTDIETLLLIKLIANTGLRITEACNLTKADLDSKKISIKNKGKNRVIGLPLWLRKELISFFKNIQNNGCLFIKSQSSYRTQMKNAAKIAKVSKEKVYPHAFRHFYAKQYLEKNGGELALGELKMILGHSDIKTTMIYLEYNDEEIAEKMARSRNR